MMTAVLNKNNYRYGTFNILGSRFETDTFLSAVFYGMTRPMFFLKTKQEIGYLISRDPDFFSFKWKTTSTVSHNSHLT